MFAEKRATVLLVDDDDTVRGFASLALEKQKFKVIQAANGEGALNAYKEHCGEVDLVITDIVMPGMFGDQLAVSLWKRNAALPIIFISGQVPETLEPGVTLHPGRNYLGKPFTLSEFLDLVRRTLTDLRPVPARPN